MQILSTAPMAFLDLETTGLDLDARVVEVAVVHLDHADALPRLAFRSRVNPERELRAMTTSITGITEADVADAPLWSDVADQVLAAIGDRTVAAFNVPADYGWLRANNQRVGATEPPWPWLDVLVCIKDVDRYRKSKRLADACQRRGIAVDAHGAAGDAIATALLWRALVKELDLGYTPLDAFLVVQRDRALNQESDFCDYVRQRYGTEGERPSCPWHVLAGLDLPYWPEPCRPTGSCPSCRLAAVYRVSKDGSVTLEAPDGGAHECPPSFPMLEEHDDDFGQDEEP